MYYKVWCVSVCGHWNVLTLTSPPVLKLRGTQGYLWLPYDLTKVNNKANYRNICAKKILYVIPFALLSLDEVDCFSDQNSLLITLIDFFSSRIGTLVIIPVL